MLRKALRVIFSLWTWFCVVFVIIVGIIPIAITRLFVFPFDPNKMITGRMYRFIAVSSSMLSPLWRFKVYGNLPKNMPSKTVVVSNHSSNADPFLISYLPWEMKWLAKAELFSIPVFGSLLRLAGDIPISRKEKDSIEVAMSKCAQYLRNDVPVMIFPEGTRSKTIDMLPFKDGAFRLAIEEQADILPLGVAGTTTALSKGSWLLSYSKAFVVIGEPISTKGLTLENVHELKERVRTEIERLRSSIIAESSDAKLVKST
jgi:1-acyl-sn-glycerol-3-phosphate acyltransferase